LGLLGGENALKLALPLALLVDHEAEEVVVELCFNLLLCAVEESRTLMLLHIGLE